MQPFAVPQIVVGAGVVRREIRNVRFCERTFPCHKAASGGTGVTPACLT